jgi:hypothetical protein
MPNCIGDFRELILAHRGKRICVMGGAPTLAEHLAGITADVYISTNAHGVGIRQPDYLLAMDEHHSRENRPMGTFLRSKCDAPILSPHRFANYRIAHWPQTPRFILSGLVAAWAAYAMGARVVILAGCDGYSGEEGYVDEARKVARDICCPVRVAGNGTLLDVWPAYDPDEKFGKYVPHANLDTLRGIDGQTRVVALKPCTVGRIELDKGQEMTAARHEVARLLKHRMVREL